MRFYVVDHSMSSFPAVIGLLRGIEELKFEYLVFKEHDELLRIRKLLLDEKGEDEEFSLVLVAYLPLYNPSYRLLHEVAAELYDSGLRVGRIIDYNSCSDYVPYELRRKWETIIEIQKMEFDPSLVRKSSVWDLVSSIVDNGHVNGF